MFAAIQVGPDEVGPIDMGEMPGFQLHRSENRQMLAVKSVWMMSDFWAEQAGQQGDVLQDMGKEPALP